MDTVFGPENFQNEIIWKRTSGHSDALFVMNRSPYGIRASV